MAEPTSPRILLLDIETAPHLAYCWGLFKQNISANQVENSGYVLCWAASWLGENTIKFASVQRGGAKRMLREIHRLLDKADIVITYNGNSFDLPILAKEFILQGFSPPEPYKSVDLCKVVQKQFRFASSKLDFVCKALGIGAKVRHAGFDLWVGCMRGVRASWKEMEAYNRMDVVILERLYGRLRPWVISHPNMSTLTDKDCCPSCGSEEFQSRGVASTAILTYRRYQCLAKGCGKWFRSGKSLRSERKERFRAA